MEDSAEVHREGRPKAAIARQLGMSGNTVERLLGVTEPPRYERGPAGSQLDPFTGRIAAMLAAYPTSRATVIWERLQPLGCRGGISILKEHLRQVRPTFLPAWLSSERPISRARSARSTGGTPGSECRSAEASAERPSVWSQPF